MVSVIPKHMAAFNIGVDHALFRRYKDDGNPDNQWTGLARVGGTWVGDPVSIKRINGEANIFMLDTNHDLHHSVFNFLLGHGLGPWKNLGGPLLGPPAVTNSKGTLHIFHIGKDRALYHNSYDGHNHTPFERLGGVFLHTPAAVSTGQKQVSVFAVGLVDGILSRYSWTESTGWDPPTQLPGIWAGALSAVSDHEGFYDVFGIDPTGKINHVSWRNETHSFQTINGLFQTIDAVSWGPERIDLIGLGLDCEIYHKANRGNTWIEWENLRGKFVYRPTPITHSPGTLTVIGVGMNSATYINIRHPNTGLWGGWTSIGGASISRVA